MPKHYIYRMDHDTGIAPNVNYGICTLSGCKPANIEAWAKQGSLVVGIGGNNTGKPDKLIYAMKVEENLPYAEFKLRYPRKGEYLRKTDRTKRILISREFYYFGDNAIDLPKELRHIIIRRQGCKCISSDEASRLQDYLAASFHLGKHGDPNNAPANPCKPC